MEIDYANLPVKLLSEVPAGSKVKLQDDPAGRMFIVGAQDRFDMISLHRGDRIEVSAQPWHPVVVHERAAL